MDVRAEGIGCTQMEKRMRCGEEERKISTLPHTTMVSLGEYARFVSLLLNNIYIIYNILIYLSFILFFYIFFH